MKSAGVAARKAERARLSQVIELERAKQEVLAKLLIPIPDPELEARKAQEVRISQVLGEEIVEENQEDEWDRDYIEIRIK